jgi:hypothetical protein
MYSKQHQTMKQQRLTAAAHSLAIVHARLRVFNPVFCSSSSFSLPHHNSIPQLFSSINSTIPSIYQASHTPPTYSSTHPTSRAQLPPATLPAMRLTVAAGILTGFAAVGAATPADQAVQPAHAEGHAEAAPTQLPSVKADWHIGCNSDNYCSYYQGGSPSTGDAGPLFARQPMECIKCTGSDSCTVRQYSSLSHYLHSLTLPGLPRPCRLLLSRWRLLLVKLQVPWLRPLPMHRCGCG